MADHSPGNASNDMESHRNTYEGFLKGSVALAIHCGYILIALADFRFVQHWNVFLGFSGIIIGAIAILIDIRMGRWFLSPILLVLFGLISAYALS